MAPVWFANAAVSGSSELMAADSGESKNASTR